MSLCTHLLMFHYWSEGILVREHKDIAGLTSSVWCEAKSVAAEVKDLLGVWLFRCKLNGIFLLFFGQLSMTRF